MPYFSSTYVVILSATTELKKCGKAWTTIVQQNDWKKGGWKASADWILSPSWRWLISLNSTFQFNESELSDRGTCPFTQPYINIQTCVHTFHHNYSPSNSHAFCHDADTPKALPLHSLTSRKHNKGWGGWDGCLLLAVAVQILPGGLMISSVCGVVFTGQLWWPAAHFTKALETPQMVDLDRHSKMHTYTLFDAHTHTHSDVHLRGHPLQRGSCSPIRAGEVEK